MDRMQLRELRKQAKLAVSTSDISPRKVTLCFCAILYGADLLFSLLDYLVRQSSVSGISATLRLQNISSIFSAATLLLSVFAIIWNNCYCGYARELVRSKSASFSTITGYLSRSGCFFGVRFLTVLYITLWTVLFMIPGYMLLVQAVSAIPLTEELLLDYDAAYAVIEGCLSSSPMLPYIIILLALAAIAGVFIGYRYRLGQYFALEPGFRAKNALRASRSLMRGHIWECFRLDLSLLWYFFILAFLSSALSLLPRFLSLDEGAFLLISAGYYIFLLIIQVHALPYVQSCYALFADNLMYPGQDNTILMINDQNT